jgi:hypothetical protein
MVHKPLHETKDCENGTVDGDSNRGALALLSLPYCPTLA